MYKSSVLNFQDNDDHDCPTCRFLRGDKSEATLLEVIKNLDHVLDEKERLVESLMVCIATT